MTDTLQAFQDLGISSEVLRALSDMGFEEPSPIQEKTIPLCLQGFDLIGQAQTGTGKTAAFAVPLVERVDGNSPYVQALILTPTRELCIQVAGEVAKIGKYSHLKTLPVYGGQSVDRQIRALHHGVQVIIGTPGRVMDHINRGTLKLEHLKILVLDEADEMLDMGFVDDVEFILQKTPSSRQTLLFSATMPNEILRLSNRYLKDPKRITISPERLAAPKVQQVYYEMRGHDRVDGLTRILDMENVDRAIVFCRTKKSCDELSEDLQARGYLAEAIHGDLNQAQRDRVMRRFRDGTIELLVATDVAARGIDIENISHVVNYEIPQDPEAYVHRIGRTGRAGRSGVAITLIHPREFKQLRTIERSVKSRIERRDVPSLADLAERQREIIKEKLVAMVNDHSLGEYKEIISDLLEDYDSVDLAAAALKMASMRDKDSGSASGSAEDYGDTGAEAGMVRLFINVGRMQNVTPADVVRTVATRSGIPGSLIGSIDIYDKFTFVEVPKDVASRVLSALEQANINGRPLNVEPAKRR